jgi:hypothetical protein
MPADSNASAGSRPSEYTADIGSAICGQLAEGKSLRAICADPGIPDKATVLGWLACREEFRKQWESAQCCARSLGGRNPRNRRRCRWRLD